MTFSIVAYSREEESWGVAVASKFLAAPAVVSWARAGAGAVATQAFARVSFGSQGLDMMQGGLSAEDTLAKLLSTDEDAEDRQVGLVDAKGNVVAYTGSECMDYAGHIIGEGFTCQGNILAGKQVLDAMALTFRQTEGDLATRLVATLLAGDRAGGDRRGRQSAGVLVVKAGGGYGGDNDRYIDLRVDDHEDPVVKLGELVKLHNMYFGASDPETLLPIDDSIARELQTLLKHQGYYEGDISGEWDDDSQDAFWDLVGVENLEERWSLDDEPEKIDPVILEFLRQKFGKS